MDRVLYERCLELCDEFIELNRRHVDSTLERMGARRLLDNAYTKNLNDMRFETLRLKELLQMAGEKHSKDPEKALEKYKEAQRARIEIGREAEELCDKLYEKEIATEKLMLKAHAKQREFLAVCSELGFLSVDEAEEN